MAKVGNVAADEMLRVFNCGIGMVLVTSEPERVLTELEARGESAFLIGEVVRSDKNYAVTAPVSFS